MVLTVKNSWEKTPHGSILGFVLKSQVTLENAQEGGTTETHRLTQTSTDQHRPAQTGTDLHKTSILYYLGPEWNQWDQLGPLGTTWDHLGPLGTIKNVLFNTVRDT